MKAKRIIQFWIALFIVVFVVAIASTLAVYLVHWRNLRSLEATCESIARWAQTNCQPGSYQKIALPPEIVVPAGSETNLVKTPQGAVIVLLKTDIGWKENYDGVLYSTAPIGPVTKVAYDREEVDIPGIDNWTPVVSRRISPQFFQVFFDLN